MARLVVYKSPAVGGLDDESAIAWEDLAERLRGLGHEVRREDKYMEPGRLGLTWYEVVLVYLGIKALDTVTGDAMDAVLHRVIDVAKVWGRERFRKEPDKPRLRPLVISFLDEDGTVLHSWKIDKDGDGEQTLADDQAQNRYPHMDLESDSGADNALTKRVAVGGREPAVRLLCRLSEGHLVVYAFVGDQHRSTLDITTLPMRFAVTPSNGRWVIFRVVEASNPAGVEMTAPGWRCDLSVLEEGIVLILCYEEL